MSQKALICVVILFCLKIQINAQVPTLDPSQTVNTATGEMGFSLPLGSVQGTNGTSFPIGVTYQAGIQTNQEASAVGLGFGFGAGAITRKVLYVPDDNNGGSGSFTKFDDYPDCDETPLGIIFTIIMVVVGVVMTVLSCIFPGFMATYGPVIGFFIAIAQIGFVAITYHPQDYIAGGAHLKDYQPIIDPLHPELVGKGYFKEKGNNRDIPDLYFVSTPYISGELVWCGTYNPAVSSPKKEGYFVFKSTSGSKKDKRTVKVDYDIDNEKFIITLANGTKLFFEETQNGGTSYTRMFWQRYGTGVECKAEPMVRQLQRVPRVPRQRINNYFYV